MKIGIDIDDVTSEFFSPFLEYVNKINGTSIKFEDITVYRSWEIMGVSQEKSLKSSDDFHAAGCLLYVNLIEGSKESINKLSQEHEVVFITSRPPHWEKTTHEFLKKHELHFPVHFAEHLSVKVNKKKSEICLEHGVNIMIEDSKEHALDCAEKGIKVFLLDKPWNQNFEHENVERVRGWKEILEILERN
jgi:uncharacterized HAD superfamily protein